MRNEIPRWKLFTHQFIKNRDSSEIKQNQCIVKHLLRSSENIGRIRNDSIQNHSIPFHSSSPLEASPTTLNLYEWKSVVSFVWKSSLRPASVYQQFKWGVICLSYAVEPVDSSSVSLSDGRLGAAASSAAASSAALPEWQYDRRSQNWRVSVVAKLLSCGVVRLKAKALRPCSDVLHSETGFAVSMTNRSLYDKLFRRGRGEGGFRSSFFSFFFFF